MITPKIRSEVHPSVWQVLRFFSYSHLDPEKQEISKKFHDFAHTLVDQCPEGPEVTVGLRKLLEAKDCFVRSSIPDL